MARGPNGNPAAETAEEMMLAALTGVVSLARDRAGVQDGRGMSKASDQTDIPAAEMAEAMMLAALPGVVSLARDRAGADQDCVLVEERRDSAGPRKDALYSVGWAYYAGEGAPQDHAEAAEWFERAIELGHPKCMRVRAPSVNSEVPLPALDRWHAPAGPRRTDEGRPPDPNGTPPTKDVPGSSSTRAPSSSTQEEGAPTSTDSEVRIAGLQLPQPEYEALKSAIIAEYLQGQHEESVDAFQNLNWVSHVESGETNKTSVQAWDGSQLGVGEGIDGVRTAARPNGRAATVYELDRERRREREREERARFIDEGELVSLKSPLVGCLVGSFSSGHKRASDECNERRGGFSLTAVAVDKMQGEMEEQLERWRGLQKDWETVTEYDSLMRHGLQKDWEAVTEYDSLMRRHAEIPQRDCGGKGTVRETACTAVFNHEFSTSRSGHPSPIKGPITPSPTKLSRLQNPAYLGLVVTTNPPHAVMEVEDLMDMNMVKQGEPGYSNEVVNPGDLILSIDGHEAQTASLDRIHEMLRGELHSAVALDLLRPSTNTMFTVRCCRHRNHEYSNGDGTHLRMVSALDNLESFDASLECAQALDNLESRAQVMARLHQMESNLKAVSLKHSAKLDKTEHEKRSVDGRLVNFVACPIASRSERHGVSRDAEGQDAVKEHGVRVRVRSDRGVSMRVRVRLAHKRFRIRAHHYVRSKICRPWISTCIRGTSSTHMVF